MAAGMDYTGIRSRHNWLTEPASPKEKTHKSKEKRRRVRDIHVRPPTIVDPLPLIQSGSLMEDGLPLDGQCGHCGGMFSRLSIAHHMKWCSRQQPRQEKDHKALQLQSEWRDTSVAPGKPLGNVVARVITVGLVPGKYEEVLIRSNEEQHLTRPKTMTLPHSALQDAGHGLPLSNGEVYRDSKYDQCKSCGNVVSAEKVAIHRRLCQGYSPVVNTGTVQIPSTHNLLKAGHKLQTKPGTDSLTSAMPSTVVCYICGRKYGSHSISIHEPQCLKKFNAQNSKLPISERLPLPKKHGSVARVLLREEEVIVMARQPRRGDMQGLVEPKEEMVQRYLESCYSEFEKELVPCRTCGRTFAPARHRKHEPNCNAKPLKLL